MANVTPLQGSSAPKPKLDELVSWEDTALFSGMRAQRYNPDDLANRRSLDIYATMRTDEQVKAVTVFKRDAITARGWCFKFAQETSLSEEEQKRRITVFSTVVSRMRGSFEDALNSIATGREFGFSLTEKVYSQVDIAGKTYIGINSLITRDPTTFDFYTDEYGVLQRFTQRVNGKLQDLDISRFIHYVHAPEFDRYFGRSDLREAYRSWFAKDALVKMWLIYLERLGGGFAVATRTAESNMANGTPEYAALQNMMRNIKSASGIILPKGVELEVILPASTDQYEQAIVFHDLAIAKALLVPNLLGISHTGQTGAYSQSQTQFDAFLWTLNADAKRLEATLNEQLFRDIGDQNFGDGEYPEFSFNPASFEHMKWTITMWKDLLASGAVKAQDSDEAYIRGLLDMPEKEQVNQTSAQDQNSTDAAVNGDAANADVASTITANAAASDSIQQAAAVSGEIQSTALNGAQVTGLLSIIDAIATGTLPASSAKAVIKASFPVLDDAVINAIVDPIEVKEPVTPDPFAGGNPLDPQQPPMPPENNPPPQNMHRVVAHTHDGKPRSCSVKAFNRAAARVQFSVIERKADTIKERHASAIAARIAKAVQYAIGDPSDFLEEPTRIQDAKFSGDDVGKLKQLSVAMLSEAWATGRDLARNEIDRAKGDKTFSEGATARFASLRSKASEYFEANGFRMAGNMSDGARAIIQQELQIGVKAGQSPAETKAAIWDRLTSRGFTNKESVRLVEDESKVMALLDELWVDTEEAALSYINTLVTTNTFEALNEARFAEFTDPALDNFVEGLEYSAVLDETTTVICRELNGLKLLADNEAWDTLRPPNHYNCRSLLIPITSIDGWDGVEDEIPAVEPQEGF